MYGEPGSMVFRVRRCSGVSAGTATINSTFSSAGMGSVSAERRCPHAHRSQKRSQTHTTTSHHAVVAEQKLLRSQRRHQALAL
eukprot:SAG31_NODE_30160_length_384_cov_2.719298_1_plen_82_part_10